MAMEKFHFASQSHGEIVAEKFKNLPIGVSRRVRKLAPEEQIFEFVEAALDAKNLKRFDALTQDEAALFLSAWQKDSGISVGE